MQKFSRKFIKITILALSLSCLFFGCAKTDNPYLGHWEAASYYTQNVSLSSQALGPSSLDISEDGTLSAVFLGEQGSCTWEQAENGLKITSKDQTYLCPYDGTTLTLATDEVKLFFRKPGQADK